MELMLSMAVLGAAMAALLTAMSTSLGAQARLGERAVAKGLCESKLLELRTQPFLATPGETQGRFPEPWEAYAWRCRIEPPQDDDDFMRATLEIQRGERSGVHSLQTILAAPGH